MFVEGQLPAAAVSVSLIWPLPLVVKHIGKVFSPEGREVSPVVGGGTVSPSIALQSGVSGKLLMPPPLLSDMKGCWATWRRSLPRVVSQPLASTHKHTQLSGVLSAA